MQWEGDARALRPAHTSRMCSRAENPWTGPRGGDTPTTPHCCPTGRQPPAEALGLQDRVWFPVSGLALSLFTLWKEAHAAQGWGPHSPQGRRARPERSLVDLGHEPFIGAKAFPSKHPVIMTYVGGIWVITRGITKSWAHRDNRDPCSQPAHQPAANTRCLRARKWAGGSGHR